MPKVSISNGGWIVVADGEKALILINRGEKFNPQLQVLDKIQHKDGFIPEKTNDRPGRLSDGPSEHRSSMEQTDWQQRSKEIFAHELAELLNSKADRQQFNELIVVAPSQVLHALRNGLKATATAKLIDEIDKDLTNHPIDKIRSILLE